MKNMKFALLCFGLFVMLSSAVFAIPRGSYTGRDSNGNFVDTVDIHSSVNGRVSGSTSGEFAIIGAGQYFQGTYEASRGSITFTLENGAKIMGNYRTEGRNVVMSINGCTYKRE